GVPLRVGNVADVELGHQVRLGRVSVGDDLDVVAGVVLLRKGEPAQDVLERVHRTIARINDLSLPVGVKLSPYQDRTVLMHRTTPAAEDNLRNGFLLVTVVPLVFLGSLRCALIVALTIPFALMFAAVCMNLAAIPANLLSIGALDFGMVVDGSIVVVENVFRR